MFQIVRRLLAIGGKPNVPISEAVDYWRQTRCSNSEGCSLSEVNRVGVPLSESLGNRRLTGCSSFGVFWQSEVNRGVPLTGSFGNRR